jgi:hypothetical protein
VGLERGPLSLVRITEALLVQNSQNYCFFLLFPSSGILENTTFRKLDLFQFSGEGGGKTPTQLGPLEKANLKLFLRGPTEYVSSPPPSPEDGNRSSFRNVVFSRIPEDGKKSKNPVIM